MLKRFLGIGLAFPVELTPDGVLAHAEYEQSVRQSIWIILGTAKGERVMRPGFGCGIHDLVFAAINPTTLGRVTQEVHDALLSWEPRIEVLDVTVAPQGDGEVLVISIDYQVRATNNMFNLVYPFYLQQAR
jgi:hypothetical protein